MFGSAFNTKYSQTQLMEQSKISNQKGNIDIWVAIPTLILEVIQSLMWVAIQVLKTLMEVSVTWMAILNSF